MRFLIVYGESEGKPQKTAKFARTLINKSENVVELLDCGRFSLVVSVPSFDAVIIVGMVQAGIHQEPIVDFILKYRDVLQNLPVMLISINPSLATDADKLAARSSINELIDDTEFAPTKTLLTAGAIQTDDVNRQTTPVENLDGLENGVVVAGNDDLTDWVQLSNDIKAFVRVVTGSGDRKKIIEPTSLRITDPLYDHFQTAPIASVGRRKLRLNYGAEISVSVSDLFEDCIVNNTSYVPINLPDWLKIDFKNGLITGTVPDDGSDPLPVECIIYAVDYDGNSAKAALLLEGHRSISAADHRQCKQDFTEGSSVSIETVSMFVESGLDTNGLEFSAAGLPDGLSIDSSDGMIRGKLEDGSAQSDPYEITVTAADKDTDSASISMLFPFKVIKILETA